MSCLKIIASNSIEDEITRSGLPGKCLKAVEKGPCKSYKKRFYYNTQNQRCERFLYGGCKGNENNFDSLTECAKTCGGQRKRTGPIIGL